MFQAPTITPVNKVILMVTIPMFLLTAILQKTTGWPLTSYLGLSTQGIMGGHIYQIITYPLVAQGLMGILFNALILWFIGSDLETTWGRKTYVEFLAVAVLGAAFGFLIFSNFFFSGAELGLPLMGLTGINYALLLAYSIIYADRQLAFMMIFPMKAKYFCWILIGIELYLGVFSAGEKTSWGHLAAMASGYGYLQWKSRSLQKRKASRKRSSHLHIVENKDDDNGPTYH